MVYVKLWFVNKHNIFILFSRLCLLGSNCDMFEYGSGTCKMMPHNALKGENLFKVATKDTSGASSLYVLQCSTPYENVLSNNDLYLNTYEGNESI